jgi:hypothetical protein
MRRWRRPRSVAVEAAGQTGLFVPRSQRQSDPPATSRAARRENLRSGANARQKALALSTVRAHPGSTITELTSFATDDHPDVDRYCFSRRLPELERAGLVIRTGERPCHLTGRLCTTWEAVN